ncbi:hypothetical protein [Roseibium sediminicola]|uniref:Ig-like domain-containing protein n=1 Tax=Roseibium sediminicola TaxID=2933272 RepID=A0ABT0H3M1_9HYPH|nr:hypothetical protein [Roseibium sp. CAU 1639]MCK7616266.1 hypothetical protein [Roseibium sp. CAU 1639]
MGQLQQLRLPCHSGNKSEQQKTSQPGKIQSQMNANFLKFGTNAKELEMKKMMLIAVLTALSSSPAFAADENAMIDKCRSYAASHLNADAGMIDVSVQTARVDGTIPVNGEVEGTGLTFQCSFNAAGTQIVQWWNSAPENCPADVSEADRYLYPACN